MTPSTSVAAAADGPATTVAARASSLAGQRVLVLDGHTNQALASVRSLGAAGAAVVIASQWRWALAGWSVHCSARYHLAGETLESFARLRAWAVERGITCVLPLTERSCQLCNAARREWESAGITVGCASADVLLRAFDKARTLEYAEASGIRCPATRAPASMEDGRAAAAELGYPCIVKSRFSNPWDGEVFLPSSGPAFVSTPEELDRALHSRRQGDYWPLVQEIVPGRGKGVFALYDHGSPRAWFAHERLREVRPSGSGSSLRRSVPLTDRLRQPAERLLDAMEWHGPAMVEFRDDDEAPPCLMEVNGRFWGSLQLAISAGVDFPQLWIALLTGAASPTACIGEYHADVTLRWLWGDVKRFASVLAGPPSTYSGGYPTRAQGLQELLGRQPPGTRLETWLRSDPWPAVGEWVQGATEVLQRGADGRLGRGSP